MIKDYSSESFAAQNDLHKLGEDVNPFSVEFNIVEFYNKDEVNELLSGYATEKYVNDIIAENKSEASPIIDLGSG